MVFRCQFFHFFNITLKKDSHDGNMLLRISYACHFFPAVIIGIRVEYSYNYIQMIFYSCKKSPNHIQWYDYRLQNPCKLAGDMLMENIRKHSDENEWFHFRAWKGFWKFRIKCKNLVKRILKKKYKNANFLYKLKSIFFG